MLMGNQQVWTQLLPFRERFFPRAGSRTSLQSSQRTTDIGRVPITPAAGGFDDQHIAGLNFDCKFAAQVEGLRFTGFEELISSQRRRFAAF